MAKQKKNKPLNIKKDYSKEVRRFKGMFSLWLEHDGLQVAAEWLACHVGRLIAEMEELKKGKKEV